MAKDATDIPYRTRVGRGERRHERGLRRLERRLAAVRAVEEKRSRQAAKARAQGAARKLQAKRSTQLEEARLRGAAIEAAIAGLRAAAAVAEASEPPLAEGGAPAITEPEAPRATGAPAVTEAGTPAAPGAQLAEAEAPAVTGAPAETPATEATAGPRGYCLRERRSVELANPHALVMRNGRAGIAGTCPGCGARIVRAGRL